MALVALRLGCLLGALLAGASSLASDARQHRASHHLQQQQHRSGWPSRHGAAAVHHYPHARHDHSSGALLSQRRESRHHNYRSLARSHAPATPATTTGSPRAQRRRLGALSLEPSAPRSVARGAEHALKDSYAFVYPVISVAATPPTLYPQYQPGRRVCSSRITDATSSPSSHQRDDRQARFVYPEAQGGELYCCPGWTQVTRWSSGCNKPVCSLPCHNGGVCSSPGRCTCPKGFTGNYCQTDVDECITEKPCDQICRNVPGSYECYCRSGYVLQPDRQSCRKNGSDGTALEARDLIEDFEETTTTTTRRPILHSPDENDVNNNERVNSQEELIRRLIKLEKQIARGWKREIETNEIATKIASAIDSINEIKSGLRNMQSMQQEVYELQNKVKLYEFETRRIQHLMNRVTDLENRVRLRCRSNVYLSHGSPY